MPSNHLVLCHPLLLHLQAFPASGSFPISQLFVSGGQSIGASASVLPMNIQDRFPLGWTGLIFLLSKGLSRVFSSTTSFRGAFGNSREAFLALDHVVGVGTRGGARRQKLDQAQDGGHSTKNGLAGMSSCEKHTELKVFPGGSCHIWTDYILAFTCSAYASLLDCRVLLVTAPGSEWLKRWLYSSVFQGLAPPRN